MVRHGVLVRELGDELVVLDTVADRVHRLNASAAAIWRQYVIGVTAERIAASLAEEFDIAPELALSDVRSTIESFARLGLTVTLDPAPDRESGSDHDHVDP